MSPKVTRQSMLDALSFSYVPRSLWPFGKANMTNCNGSIRFGPRKIHSSRRRNEKKGASL
jgi:hypothetical protein